MHMQDLISNSSRPIAEACNSAGEGYSASASAQPDIHRGYRHNRAVGDSQAHVSVAQLGKVTLHNGSSMAQSKQPMAASTAEVHAQQSGRNNGDNYVGRATKLTHGPPGQITLVRSPNGVKRTAVQLTEPQQQHLQQQRQQQLLPEHQQSTMKGHRSHRVRKTKVPAVATVIADPLGVAREVQNAVDMSGNQESDSHKQNTDAAG